AYARKAQLKQDAEALDTLVNQGMTLHRIDREKMQEMVKEPLLKVVADMELTDLYQMIKGVN
ncbi:MAG: C4-dicarboxylate ABC transporter substrate-binding protein, partial [Cobetia crustatorum]